MIFFNNIYWQNFTASTFLLLLLLIAVLIQLFYIVFVFSRIVFFKKKVNTPSTTSIPVSIVVCAHNELDNLKELLPLLNAQDYSEFDINILDDRSTDGTFEYLCNEGWQFDKLRFWRFDKEHDHVTPKKYALTAGIRQAKYDTVLLTDADCRPASNEWLREMAAQRSLQKQIVLGVSPYKRGIGFLNKFIRFETFFTAVQYLSFALWGRPYMGVGRNLMYSKELFVKNKGYYSHLKVMGGDDDLLINEIATTHNTTICIDQKSYCESIPKSNWDDWFVQKERHLSVGKHYLPKNKLILGLLSGTQVASWLLFFILLAMFFFVGTAHFVILASFFLGLRVLVNWLVLVLINHKLGNFIHWIWIPIMDFLMFVYYMAMGVVLWANRNKKIRWK